ncbi:hypothetical protein AKJ48_04345 [candidate division MSBL1 archaeon SCGC-AAA261O19]|uniref:Uncharacterized protein n=1 Tax=candidate division MSBL1 archaeon SCGC-AAA261O19 TaxID=1698277 RepID=A0A133V9B1_9EURY|nr:hypothetical protein AKJ48_04345 [candidate division MSBL1 archaeon SCGC-AAA261O19]
MRARNSSKRILRDILDKFKRYVSVCILALLLRLMEKKAGSLLEKIFKEFDPLKANVIVQMREEIFSKMR